MRRLAFLAVPLALAGCAGSSAVRPAGTLPPIVERTDLPDAPTEPPGPRVADYDVTPKVINRQCFGSAGCSVEIRLKVAKADLDDGQAVDLTVKITGDEAGPIIRTISLDEDGGFDSVPVTLSTRSSGTKVRVKVTEVEARD
jgi:hypothetical protein